MLTDLVSVDRFRINIEISGDAGAESGGIEDGAGADDLLGGKTREFESIVSQYVHGVGNDKKNPVKSGGHDLLNHALEDVDVFGEELHASFAWFLSGASGNDYYIAVMGVFVGAIFNFDVARSDGESVAKIHGFAFGVFGDDVG